MSRPSKWISALAFCAIFGFATPSIVVAAPDDTAENAFNELSSEQQSELRKAAELLAAGKDRNDPEVLRHVNAAAAYGQAAEQAARNQSMSGQLEQLKAQIEREQAAAERDREMYDKPSVWEEAGSQILQGLIAALMDVGKQKLNDWINGGGENDALLDQIKDLEDERIRLEEELAGGGTGSDNGGLGEVITDPNGNTGYDTDGNGYVDVPLYPNGDPGTPGTDLTDPSITAPGSVLPGPITDSSSLDNDDTSLPGVGGSGGASLGGNSGPGFNFGGANTPDAGGLADAGAEGEDADGDGLPDGAAGAGGALGEAGSLDPDAAGGANGTSSGSESETDEDGAPLDKKFGRVIVLPKLEFEDLAGNRKANDNWSEEWKDDSWDDSADNGDFDEDWADDEDWGGEWDAAAKKGEKAAADEPADTATTTAEDQQTAELVDQIIRVETAVAEWRKLEAKAKEAGVDPYGYQDEEMGYRASGGEAKDPFKDVRTKDGKIDLTKVDVWLIADESWKDGEEPIRYRLKIDPEEITDFEPIHGGVAMIQGVLNEVDVDKRVLDEIKGKVKEIDVRRVMLSAEKPPEDQEALDGEGLDLDSEDSDSKGLDTPGEKALDGAKPSEEGSDEGWDDEGW